MHDIEGLIALRPLLVESGERDNIFPIAASVESFTQVREVYGVFQAADRVEQEVFPAEHSFWGEPRHPVHREKLVEISDSAPCSGGNRQSEVLNRSEI